MQSLEKQQKVDLMDFPLDADIEVPSPLNPLQKKAREYLISQYSKGVSDNRSVDLEVLDGYESHSSDVFFQTYQYSPDFGIFYSLAESEAIGRDHNQERFRGALFASMAYAYLRTTETNRVVVSPQATFRVTQILHPESQVAEHLYDTNGLMGIYVPDALLMEEEENRRKVVSGVYEISLSSDHAKYASQAEGFLTFKKDLGPMAQAAKFLIVTPNSSIITIPSHLAKNVEIISLPFPLWDFSDFADNVENLYRRGGDHASLAELRNERKIQVARVKSIGEPSFFRKDKK